MKRSPDPNDMLENDLSVGKSQHPEINPDEAPEPENEPLLSTRAKVNKQKSNQTSNQEGGAPMVGSDKILTISDVAIFLKIPKSSVYKLIHESGLPAHKVGKHFRFVQREVRNWLQEGTFSNGK